MCFPDVRLGYGQDKAGSVIDKLKAYHRDFGVDETVAWAMATLTSYFEFHGVRDYDLSELGKKFAELSREVDLADLECPGGYEVTTAQQIQTAAMIDFQRFMENRHSVRQYAKGSI